MTDRKTLDQAREWAERVLDNQPSPDKEAAAEVIRSLPHEWVDASFIHDTITQMNQVIEEPVGDDYALGYDAATAAWRDHLRSLLPAPAPRTLADMTPAEPEFDPAHLYRDVAGDHWENIDGKWVCGTKSQRREWRANGHGVDAPRPDYAPYTRIDQE